MSKKLSKYRLVSNNKPNPPMSMINKQEQTKTRKNTVLACCLVLCIAGIIEPAYADWFNVGDIQKNLIKPIFDLVNDNLGYIAFAIGGAATFLARGQDMWQKATAFGLGSLGTAGAVKLAQTVLHLG